MYVIYHKETTKLQNTPYKTMAAAKAGLTRMNNAWAKLEGKLANESDSPQFIYGIAEIGYYYDHIERTVTRINLMSGKPYQESVNTTLACSPASETYWSI